MPRSRPGSAGRAARFGCWPPDPARAAVGALAGALGGAIVALPRYSARVRLRRTRFSSISIAAFAVGGLIGGLIVAGRPGVATGVLAGLVGGALVRLLWNAVGFSGEEAFEEALGIGIQCLLIVGLVLAALPLSAQPRSTPRPAH